MTGKELLRQAEKTGKPVKIGNCWRTFGGEVDTKKLCCDVKYLGKRPEKASQRLKGGKGKTFRGRNMTETEKRREQLLEKLNEFLVYLDGNPELHDGLKTIRKALHLIYDLLK